MRILLADDSPFWREQIRAILEEDPDWSVYEANNGSEAVRKSSWIHQDVVILDMCMPVLDGLGAARRLKDVTPELPVLVITVDSLLRIGSTPNRSSSGIFQDGLPGGPQLPEQKLQTQAA